MYKYETHLHTFPVSCCAKATVEESLVFYKNLGYDGVFITNHFLDGNINVDKTKTYEEKINFHFSDYELRLFAGTDNHVAGNQRSIAGMRCAQPVDTVEDFVEKFKNGQLEIFTLVNE